MTDTEMWLSILTAAIAVLAVLFGFTWWTLRRVTGELRDTPAAIVRFGDTVAEEFGTVKATIKDVEHGHRVRSNDIALTVAKLTAQVEEVGLDARAHAARLNLVDDRLEALDGKCAPCTPKPCAAKPVTAPRAVPGRDKPPVRKRDAAGQFIATKKPKK